MSDTYADQLKDWERLLAAVRGEDPPDQVPDRELDIAEIVQEARSTMASTSWRQSEIEEARASGRAVVQEGTEQARRHCLWLRLQISLGTAKLVKLGRSPYRKKGKKAVRKGEGGP